jgi:hypothetical protein
LAEFSDIEKINIAYKAVNGVLGTYNGRGADGFQVFNEDFSTKSFILNDDIWMQNVPRADTYTEAVNNVQRFPKIVEQKTIRMSPVPGTNLCGWAAFAAYSDITSGIINDWIQPQLFGRGYALQLFQDNGSFNPNLPMSGEPGNEIMTAQGIWLPNYKLGFIIMGDSGKPDVMGWKMPLWVKVFRYIGTKGIYGNTVNTTLNDAYKNGTSMDLNNGPLVLNTDQETAAIQIKPNVTAPTERLEMGQISLIDNVLYMYDKGRNKWLSINKDVSVLSARYGAGNYLSNGRFAGIHSGYTAPYKCTLTGLTANIGSGQTNKRFKLMKNGNFVNLKDFQLENGSYITNSLSIDFNRGDIVQIYFAPGAQTYNPIVTLEVRQRA